MRTARGCCFCLGVKDDAGVLRGVAIVGRPNARMLQNGLTAEITRLATDGCPNACSALLSFSLSDSLNGACVPRSMIWSNSSRFTCMRGRFIG